MADRSGVLTVNLRREPPRWRRAGIARRKNPRPARAVAHSTQQRNWTRDQTVPLPNFHIPV